MVPFGSLIWMGFFVGLLFVTGSANVPKWAEEPVSAQSNCDELEGGSLVDDMDDAVE
jgi:hypothetical protein